jgi:hypothetical protein
VWSRSSTCTGRRSRCFNDAPCPPLTSHGASITSVAWPGPHGVVVVAVVVAQPNGARRRGRRRRRRRLPRQGLAGSPCIAPPPQTRAPRATTPPPRVRSINNINIRAQSRGGERGLGGTPGYAVPSTPATETWLSAAAIEARWVSTARRVAGERRARRLNGRSG